MDAHHELLLSNHFPNYLGHNLIQDENYYQHFLEISKGETMKKLLKHVINLLFFRKKPL